MTETTLAEQYVANRHGVISCYDRLIVTGTAGVCDAGGMTSFLYSSGIRILDPLALPSRCASAAAGAQLEHVKTRPTSARKTRGPACWLHAATLLAQETAEELSEGDEAQGARSAATENTKFRRRLTSRKRS